MGANVKILNDVFNGGKSVASVTITVAGTGYTSAPTVVFTAPVDGTTATGTAVLDGATVDSVTITSAGEGYVTAPTISFSGFICCGYGCLDNQRGSERLYTCSGKFL